MSNQKKRSKKGQDILLSVPKESDSWHAFWTTQKLLFLIFPMEKSRKQIGLVQV
jgi:hypothetical protein